MSVDEIDVDPPAWSATDIGLLASRQNGKNGILEVRQAYGLTVLGESWIHTAQLFPTAKESYFRLLGLLEADPDTAALITARYASPMSGYELRFRDGGRIQFLARSRTSGRGKTADQLVFDEAQDLTDEEQGALLPTISARPNAQTWYTGSAPPESALVWQRLRFRGRRGLGRRFAYMEHSAPPDSDPDDIEAWRAGNPGLGIRIDVPKIQSEFETMSPELFLRERLSISPEVIEGSGVIDIEAWQACEDLEAEAVGRVAFAIDTTPDRTWSSIAAAGAADVDGCIMVEVIDHRPGTDWLVRRAVGLVKRWGGAVAVASGSPAASLVAELEAADLEVVELAPADHAKACGSMFDSIKEHTARHRGDQDLNVAVGGAERKFYGDAWLWARRSSQVDISPLVAITLARWLFLITEEGSPDIF